MEKSPPDSEYLEPQPHYSQKLQKALDTYLPHTDVAKKDIDLTLQLLDEMRGRYGDPSSKSYLAYHNDVHAFDVVQRSARLGAIIHRYAPELFHERDFGLSLIAAAGHDIIQRNGSANVTDEILSANYVEQVMLEMEYGEQDARRAANAIIATTASHDENGVQQTHVRQHEADPLKLVVALADIQAMSMEGNSRMLKDVSRLYFELNPPESKPVSEHIEGLAKFLVAQSGFLSQRLDSLPGDLRYYFPEETAQAIEKQNRKEFRKNGLTVIHTTQEIAATAATLADTVSLYIDQIPRTPIKATTVAQKALRQVIKTIHKNI